MRARLVFPLSSPSLLILAFSTRFQGERSRVVLTVSGRQGGGNCYGLRLYDTRDILRYAAPLISHLSGSHTLTCYLPRIAR